MLTENLSQLQVGRSFVLLRPAIVLQEENVTERPQEKKEHTEYGTARRNVLEILFIL